MRSSDWRESTRSRGWRRSRRRSRSPGATWRIPWSTASTATGSCCPACRAGARRTWRGRSFRSSRSSAKLISKTHCAEPWFGGADGGPLGAQDHPRGALLAGLVGRRGGHAARRGAVGRHRRALHEPSGPVSAFDSCRRRTPSAGPRCCRR